MGKNLEGTLRAIAKELIQDMVSEISSRNRVASGKVRDSFNTIVDEDSLRIENTATSESGYRYASNVDLGRSAGKYVPIAPLVRWASIKGIVPKNNRSLRQFAFAVSKSLMERGYPGINYSAKAFLKSQDLIGKRIGDAYLKDLEEQLEKQIPNLK